MRLEPILRYHYPTAGPYEPVAVVQAALLREGFVVVMDGEDYKGLLSADDVVRSPRMLVGDCLRQVPTLELDSCVEEALERMRAQESVALPVFDQDRFVGICVRADIAQHLSRHAATLQEDLIRHINELAATTKHLATEVVARESVEVERSRLAAAVHRVDEALSLADPTGRIEYVNPAFEATTGYSAANVAEHPLYVWELFDTTTVEGKALREAIANGQSWRNEVVGLTRLDERYDADVVVSAVRGPAGGLADFIVLHRDITQRKRIEQELWRTQKLDSLRTLVAGVVHDINNMLGSILGHAELALLDPTDPRRVESELRQIAYAVSGGQRLVSRFLEFATPGQQRRSRTRLRELLADVAGLLQGMLPANIELVQRVESEPVVHADANRLEQVLLNLGTNAAQSMGGEPGVIELAVSEIALDHQQKGPLEELPMGRYARIAIRDQGCGIPAENLALVFEPFFTTRMTEGGTGLGLTIVDGVVRSHGGVVLVDSTEGEGTTVSLYLPVAPEVVAVAPRANDIPHGDESILLVDDEPDLCEVQQQLLESVGYTVVTATSADRALEILRGDPDRFDLLITDQRMPGVSGLDLAHAAHRLSPALPVLVVSGYVKELSAREVREAGVSALLSKPVTLRQLAGEVRKLLDVPALAAQ